jgi:8-oxo-dGTP diphosphatase
VEPLRVVAAAVLDAGRLLLVSKRAAPAVFYLPGGKPDPGEAPLDCLARELGEELGVGLRAAEPFADVLAPAALEGVPMAMTVFLAEIDGTPAARAEIAKLTWWPGGRELTLAPAIRDHVVPQLRRAGRLTA